VLNLLLLECIADCYGCVQSSELLSKYFGDSEKGVRQLFGKKHALHRLVGQ